VRPVALSAIDIFLYQYGDLEYIIAEVLTDFKLNFMYLCAVKYIIQRDLAGLSVWGGLGFCLGMLNRGFFIQCIVHVMNKIKGI
jgi:hypothetical protein